MLVATLHRALSRRDLPSISPLASAIEVCREPPRQRGEVIQDGLGLHLPALEILQAGSVGDERYAGGGRGHAIHPGVADDDRRAVPEALANHAPAGGIGLERVHLVARDDQVEPAQQAEAVEHVGRDLPGVVRPQRDGEAGSACALDGVAGPWLERRAVQRSPLVIERDRPQRVEERGRVTAAVRDELVHAIAIGARGQGAARHLESGPHVERHRGQIERRTDQRVIQIEHAQTHGGRRIPCYDTRVIMKRRGVTALAFLFFAFLPLSAARAVEEADRLFLVGERATADGIVPVARRALERFVQEFPKDSRLADAVLLLGRARLAVGDNEAALEAFKRAQTFQPPPGRPLEVKFWEGEALFRLRRFADARAAYESVLKADATSPLAPEAQYGLAWTELEQKHAEAAKAFREFIDTWPTHALAPSATFYLARALVEQRRFNDAAGIAGRLARPKDQEAAWKKLRAEFPDHPLAHRAALDLAKAAFKRKDYKDAATQAQAATKSEEDGVRSEALLLSGESELKLKRFPIAAKAFEAAAEMKSADAAVRYRALAGLGLAREEQREWRAALAAYESVAAKSPDPTLRDWAKERGVAVKQRMSRGGPAVQPKG